VGGRPTLEGEDGRVQQVAVLDLDRRAQRLVGSKTGSSNVVGRAHSKPMPSSHETSTSRLRDRKAARSSVNK
jgi:hypothetical protein